MYNILSVDSLSITKNENDKENSEVYFCYSWLVTRRKRKD